MLPLTSTGTLMEAKRDRNVGRTRDDQPHVQSFRQFPLEASSGPRHDHFFFSGMAILLLATVFLGFAPTYYLAGLVHAPLPSRIVQVHAAVFTSWMLLFAAQVSLVSAHRINLHRRLGVIGFLLAFAMVVSGLLASADALARNVPPGHDELLFIVNTSMVVVFAVFMALHTECEAILRRTNG